MERSIGGVTVIDGVREGEGGRKGSDFSFFFLLFSLDGQTASIDRGGKGGG